MSAITRRLAVWIDGPIKPLEQVSDYDLKVFGDGFEVVDTITDENEVPSTTLEEIRLELELEF